MGAEQIRDYPGTAGKPPDESREQSPGTEDQLNATVSIASFHMRGQATADTVMLCK